MAAFTPSISSDNTNPSGRPSLVGFPERPLCKAAAQIASIKARPAANRRIKMQRLFGSPNIFAQGWRSDSRDSREVYRQSCDEHRLDECSDFHKPGALGFDPQLSLSYDSGAGNGVFGLGWHLAMPAITRETDKGLPRYEGANDSDVFMLSGAEDLVPVFKKNADGTWTRDVKTI